MVDYALSDLIVIDLTHRIAGPFCTQLLAGLGAEVIKIEKPGEGDAAREMGPFPEGDADPDKSALFLYLNTGKKGITLNLKHPAGVKIFKELVEKADVLVENFSPRVMPSLGLSYETLQEINPRLIMTSISNFGQTGPYRDYKSEDIVAAAMGGMLYITGDQDREPLRQGGFQAQYQGGLNGFVGTLTALFYRDMTGEGQQVDISLMEVMASILEQTIIAYSYSGEITKRSGNQGGLHPWGLYPCKDGYVAVVANPTQWPRIAKLMENLQLEDPKYETMAARQDYREEIDQLMLPWLRERTMEQIYHTAQAWRLPFGYVATSADLMKSPQLKAREFFQTINHPKTGSILYPGAPFKMTETGWQMTPAPLLGQHNEEIYHGKLGYSKGDLLNMKQIGVI